MTLSKRTDGKDKRKLTGLSGENIASTYLEAKGYRLIERNFRCPLGEIDIIALKGCVICFVEVKTRKSLRYGLPCEAVTLNKQRHIIGSSRYFLKGHFRYCRFQPRFDVIEVLKVNGAVYIRMLENAFSTEQ